MPIYPSILVLGFNLPNIIMFFLAYKTNYMERQSYNCDLRKKHIGRLLVYMFIRKYESGEDAQNFHIGCAVPYRDSEWLHVRPGDLTEPSA